ncbi:MAG TPA: D-alanyl-D-alanine carboxypeptidase/D-alanyl-D-alanine-endopeptidase [Phycisphaerae bacterium]|nr:D-alanyl-D-alanine carboxypeptidase/D-alanyl-D-alanine-endopeptidase [Phycisphaerae bacterium]
MNGCKTRGLGLGLWLLTLAAGGCVTPHVRHDPVLTERLDAILTRRAYTGAIVAARVVELPNRRELYARDSDVPFTPASNMKIPVSAAALDMFGLNHSFKTYLALDGDDLWVVGTGDPGIGDARLAKARGATTIAVLDEWADALVQRGVRQIAGDLCYYDSALDALWAHPTWGDSLLHWYGAPVSGLNFNDNCVDITIRPSQSGQPVLYEVIPPVQGIAVVNLCQTAEQHAPTIVKLPGGNQYILGGTCAKEETLKSKPVDDSGMFFADALRTHLAARGITIAGELRRAPAPLGGAIPPPAEKTVAVHATNMRDMLGRINTNSQNLFAEALCKLTGQAYAARLGRQVPGSWAYADMAIRAFLRRNKIDDKGFVLGDGSGLSVDNKVTARLMTDLFAVMKARPDGDAFVDSLAKGGVNGTLEKRYAGLEGHVFAKTGYIEGVRALSGYVQTRGGRWLTFSIIYNRIPGSVTPYEALQDEAVRLLIDWPALP